MAEIEFKKGPLSGRRLALTAESYTLGRKRDLDLPLEDGMTSGEHAELRFTDGAWTIVDLGSSNGTWLNEAKVSTAPLSTGDLVQIGGSTFIYYAESAPAGGASHVPVASSDELALVEQMRDRADQIRRNWWVNGVTWQI